MARRSFRLLRWLRRIVGGMVALVFVLLLALFAALWRSTPGGDLNAVIPGLVGPVGVTLDRDGVPTIRAGSEADAAAAMGFLHARERMFQMEMMRRGASGRLSELAGPGTLRLDRFTRMLGLRHAAARDLDALPADVRDVLLAYARGVNAWIGLRGRFAGAEFVLLGPPEPWSPVDSLLWGKTMALFLSGNHRTELARAALAGTLSPDRLRELWPADRQAGTPEAALDPAGPRPGIPHRASAMGAPPEIPHRASAMGAPHSARVLAELPVFPQPFTHPASASNGWAVDARFSAAGAPLLAGDPHLGFQFPSLWYLARIELPDRVLAGATAPGVPMMVLGHNGRIAWTLTTTHADSEDIFLERPAGRDMVETPDGPRPLHVRTETIRVRGRPDEVFRVRVSRNGPIISDLDPSPPDDGLLRALRAASLLADDMSAAGLLALNRATDLDGARRAAALIVNPAQNLIVADARGIGLFVTGRIPIRRAGDGSMPVPGWDGSHDWRAVAEGEALPRIANPSSGRIVNANERVAPADFPVFLGRDWFGDWRARRIRTLLAAERQHTPLSFTAMQMDVRSEFAADILPALLRTPRPDGVAGQALDLLRGWDGTMAEAAPQPLIFNAWMRRFGAAVLREAGVPVLAWDASAEFIGFVLDRGRQWCGGTCDTLLARSLEETAQALAMAHGPAPAAWRWGSVHQAEFGHPILRFVPVLRDLVGTRVAVGGDNETVFRAGFRRDLSAAHGASFRGVYDLADLDRSLFMVAPGQSGHLLSPLGTRLAETWRDGGMRALAPGAEAAVRLQLMPEGR